MTTLLRNNIGISLALLAATMFALSLVSARSSFDSGANPLTVMLIRFLLLAMLMWLWRLYRQTSTALHWRQKLGCSALGLTYFVGIGSYLVSTTYLPVSLAVIIFYTFPILVSISASLLQGMALRWGQIAALLLAFLGLTIVMDVNVEGINLTGLFFAVLASIGITVNMLGSAHVLKRVSTTDFSFYQSFTVVVLSLVGITLTGELALPADSAGWIAFVVMLIAFIIGFFSIYNAIRRVGPVTTSSIMNLEPVMTVLFAVLLLNEMFGFHQLVGGLIVLLGVIIAQQQSRKAASNNQRHRV